MTGLGNGAPSGRQGLDAFVHALPKAELHLHLEGAVSPTLLEKLAERHGMPCPARVSEGARDYGALPDLATVLEVYDAVCGLMRSPEDFRDATHEALGRSAAGGASHVELFFSPAAHDPVATPYCAMLDGIIAGARDAQAEFGVTALIIPAHNRTLGADRGMAFLDMVLADRRDLVVGIGLDYEETGHPPAPFAPMFERARAEGLRVTAHAGEDGPASHVRDSVDRLGCRRIDHGYQIVDDADLLARCRDRDVLFTICPTSMCRTTIWRDPADPAHPIRRMIEAGLRCCVSTDVPAMFGADLVGEYRLLAEAMDIDRTTLAALAANSLSHSWRP